MPVVALLAQLPPVAREHLPCGATSQDIVDSAFVLGVREALGVLSRVLLDVCDRLALLARTHAQQALPVTFGLKAAGWLAPLSRHLERLSQRASALRAPPCRTRRGCCRGWT